MTRTRRPSGQALMARSSIQPRLPAGLLDELRQFIVEAREQTARLVDASLTLLYWRLGERIRREVLGHKRADYGEQIVSALSRQLELEFGRGFSEKSLRHMLRFAEAFPDREIVSTLSRELSWSHFLALIYLKEPLQRDFYAEMVRIEHWSVHTLRERIRSMLYERTTLSKRPEQLIAKELKALRDEDRLTPDLVFRDPYVLDFLGLKDTYSEKDLENALLREIESLLLELGAGFAFVDRQKRMTLDGDDYYLDLLFYHRRLRRLIAIELKIGDFKPADAGQMELYLRWLDRHERQEGEDKPLGLVLCAGKKRETVEMLELEPRGIHVAEYLTELPARELLERRLHDAVLRARLRLENQATHEVESGSPTARRRRGKP